MDTWEILSRVSNLMTILGVGGALTWGVFRKNEPIPRMILTVFSYSIKFSLSAAAIVPFLLVGFYSIDLLGDMFASLGIPRWLVATSVLLLLVPLYITIFLSILKGSLKPFKDLLEIMKNSDE